ncbi:MazF family transcriptional regulator [Methylobacterium sp. NEAU 140]|uniref:AbrB/MazE/SpoVT family DNA-binding domain-containing protein n=1 Tax=Methylobacterium sp. NEAU 140 TaxID=3064945 RepID=UPI0027325ACC|nr:MazF family transcriptional regulator [Methylobacterium sp. NEAU 140]MDP4023907.1 MazF family transcriptional regulator [Methylobacterium sp. NEAU 140]
MEAKLIRTGDEFVIRIPVKKAEEAGLRDGQTVTVSRSPAFLTYAEMIAEMDRLGPAYRPEVIDWGPDVGAEIIRDDYT